MPNETEKRSEIRDDRNISPLKVDKKERIQE